MTFRALIVGAVLALSSTVLPAEVTPRIAIIIDDLGYQRSLGERAVTLPGPVACAILPGTPRGRHLAELARKHGKEVLLHLPLEAANDDGPVEPGSITLDVSRTGFSRLFDEALASVPFAVGVNSHRGSLLTRHPGHMRWLMEDILAQERLFFVDSRTTHKSVAMKIALETGVAALERDVFLDADPAPDKVAAEFERLKSLARTQGYAVGIGHPYPSTLALLERELPELQAQGYVIVAPSELLALP